LCGPLYSWVEEELGCPFNRSNVKLAAIFAVDIAGYCGGSGFLDSRISQRLTGPVKA
jgi:hypothetical protein